LIPDSSSLHTGITRTVVHGRGFEHEALLYGGLEEFLRGTVPFVRDAVASGEPTLVIVGSEKLEALRQQLAGEADGVLFEDMSVAGRNPARLIPMWQDFVADHSSSSTGVRGIGEPVWVGRSDSELSECARHEALLNVAFDDVNFWLLCPYDVAGLEPEAIEMARRNHPVLRDQSGVAPSPGFSGTIAITLEALPNPPTTPVVLGFGPDDLADVRGMVSSWALAAGMSPDRRSELVTAVNEVATNSIRHGGGGGTLRLWKETGRLVCEVTDGGRIEDLLADRRPPLVRSGRGYGLWISNQLCDLVQLRSTLAGSVVRLHKAVRPPPDGA
jgi:anti-sigma regulatory factor (Ser/Thr protein kinase)